MGNLPRSSTYPKVSVRLNMSHLSSGGHQNPGDGRPRPSFSAGHERTTFSVTLQVVRMTPEVPGDYLEIQAVWQWNLSSELSPVVLLCSGLNLSSCKGVLINVLWTSGNLWGVFSWWQYLVNLGEWCIGKSLSHYLPSYQARGSLSTVVARWIAGQKE